jgi:hypothetical protein
VHCALCRANYSTGQGAHHAMRSFVVEMCTVHCVLASAGLPGTATPEKSRTWTETPGYIKVGVAYCVTASFTHV